VIVTNTGSSSVSALDARTGAVRWTVPVGLSPSGSLGLELASDARER
jgi:YVTN family beta-propeller protein